jgi:hypothetical protein
MMLSHCKIKDLVIVDISDGKKMHIGRKLR